MMRKFAVIVAAAFLAAGVVEAQGLDSTRLKTVVVSSTLIPTGKSGLSQAVTIISGEDLRSRGIVKISDVLTEVTGMMIVTNGSTGSVTSGFLRGGESNYTKVLIDNVPVNSVGGFFDYAHLTTDNIDRVEVLRGPGSVIYGADAMTGVVRIFTRRGTGNSRPRIEASARAGTYNTRDGDLSLLGGAKISSGTLDYSVGGGWHTTDGFNSFNNDYQNGTLSASVGYKIGATDVRFNTRYTAAETHFPTEFTPVPADSDSYNVQRGLAKSIEASHFVTSFLQLNLSAATADAISFSEDTDLGVTTKSKIDEYRRNVDLRANWYLPYQHTFAFGGGYQKEYRNDGFAPEPQDRVSKAVYGELSGAYGIASYTLSGRLDDHEDFDKAGTYRLGTAFQVLSNTFLRGSLATGYNAPALYQTQGSFFNDPNEDLQPERTNSWEIGVRQVLLGDRAEIAVAYFDQQFSQMIDFVFGTPSTYENLTKAESKGVDIDASLKDFLGFDINAGYNMVKARVTEIPAGYLGANVGDELIRRPSHSGRFGVVYKWSGIGSISSNVQYVGKRIDTDFSTFTNVTLPEYYKVDLAATVDAMRFTNGMPMALTVRLENAFDKKYENVLGYGAPGRTLLAGLRFNTGL